MSSLGNAPLRPSMSRGNMSTNSVPLLDSREKPTTVRSAMTGGALMSPPPLLSKAADMMRTESADTHRALRTKHSRKELRELQRSASPLVSTPTTPSSSSKHKYSRSWESDSKDDDDARSISSFTCSFASEFDKKKCNRTEQGVENISNRQRFLDAVFRKLSQKTGVHQRESRTWAVVDKTIHEQQLRSSKSSQTKKTKPHFLDLSNYISPVPSSDSVSCNVTPRPADFHCFHSNQRSEQQLPPSQPQQPTLRSRRSAGALGEDRRLQREEWSAAAHNSVRGAATAESVGSLAVGQVIPHGMSHAMLARNNKQPAPVPSLPAWARDSNRTLHTQARSIDLQRQLSNDALGLSHGLRPIDMGRAASHDATAYLQKPARPVPAPRGVSGPVRGVHDHAHSHGPPPLQLRSSARTPRSLASPLTPQWPRSAQPFFTPPSVRDECVSPMAGTPLTLLHRQSVSSAASDSGTSSGFSSVPQTPVSRIAALPSLGLHVNDLANHGDEIVEEMELSAADENDLLSGMGTYALELSKNSSHEQFAPPQLPALSALTPRPAYQGPQHTAFPFENPFGTPVQKRPAQVSHQKSSSGSDAAMSTSSMGEDGNRTVRANKMQSRPRASTVSSTNSRDREAVLTASPISPSRSSSLQKSVRRGARDSVMSTSTVSSTSTGSHSESMLSYARGSPTSSCASPVGSPQNSTVPLSARVTLSPTKRGTSRAEDWASSIGRRFARGVQKGSPDVSAYNTTADE